MRSAQFPLQAGRVRFLSVIQGCFVGNRNHIHSPSGLPVCMVGTQHLGVRPRILMTYTVGIASVHDVSWITGRSVRGKNKNVIFGDFWDVFHGRKVACRLEEGVPQWLFISRMSSP